MFGRRRQLRSDWPHNCKLRCSLASSELSWVIDFCPSGWQERAACDRQAKSDTVGLSALQGRKPFGSIASAVTTGSWRAPCDNRDARASAIDVEHSTVHEGRFIAREVDRCVGDGPGAADRIGGRPAHHRVARPLGGDVLVHHPRRNRIDANASRSKLRGPCAGQRLDGPLCRAVECANGDAEARYPGAQVDDGSWRWGHQSRRYSGRDRNE